MLVMPLAGWAAICILAMIGLIAYRMYLTHVERMQIRRDRVAYEAREQERALLELKKIAFDVALTYANLYVQLWNEGRWDRDTAPPFRVIFNPQDYWQIRATPDVNLVDEK